MALGVVALLVGTAACTVEDSRPSRAVDPEPSVRDDVASATPVPAAAPPARVRVTRVAGSLSDRDREVLAGRVGHVVTDYFDAAFLGGDYPRSSFGDAFDTFSAGAAVRADANRDLLTNRVLGPTTQSIEVRRRTAYLSVLAPHKVAAGVTARVHLRFVADRGDAPAKRVDVTGRLLLTRKASGDGWKIFGYDLDRRNRTLGEGS